jgi:hypothetical protein
MRKRREGSSARWAVAAVAMGSVLALLAASVALAGSGAAGGTARAKQATAKYRDLTVAKQAGYGLLKDKNAIACIAMDAMPGMGAMGVHYVKNALVGDGKLEASTPEALVYAPAAGTVRLAAVEYVVLKSAWDAKHQARPSLFGHAFNLTPAGNRFGLPAFYSLHAWIWKHNRAGTFAMWNPEVSCK